MLLYRCCRLRRLGESLAQRAKLLELVWLELGKTLGKVRQRGIEPLLLVIGMTSDNTALHDMLEQFVACFLIGRRSRGVTTWTKLGLNHFLWVKRS